VVFQCIAMDRPSFFSARVTLVQADRVKHIPGEVPSLAARDWRR
jgi:hypothetical protein